MITLDIKYKRKMNSNIITLLLFGISDNTPFHPKFVTDYE